MYERQYWVGFSYVPGIGPTRVRQLLEYFGTLHEAWHAPREALAQAGIDRRALKSLTEARQRIDPLAEMARLDKLGIAVFTWDDEEYPALLATLRSIDHAPPVLYVRGTLTPDDDSALAVVGTRRVTAYGRQVTPRLTEELAASGITIVSGLARGIDTLAHEAALGVDGRTIAVLPCGLDTIYPPENRRLAAQIVRQGALVTPFPLGTQPEAGNFQPRNRTLSGIARGVLVVEAGKKSGALITAGYALEQGREVFAVPGNITSKASDGANRLIQDGAMPILRANDVLEALHMEQIAQHTEARRDLPPMSDTERAIVEALSEQPLYIDQIAVMSGFPVNEVSSTLTLLALKGLVREVDTMTYVRV